MGATPAGYHSAPDPFGAAMGYAGDLTPRETFDLLSAVPDAVIVDCRTQAEWTYVGSPDLTSVGKQTVYVEWSRFPDAVVNPDFVGRLEAAGINRSAPVAFLCRTGVRSKAAAEAATSAGWVAAYNILEGFEGAPDSDGHRGTGSGWKVEGLPWKQT